MSDKGCKADFSLISTSKDVRNMQVKLQAKLFDVLILPILSYTSEIWILEFKIDLLLNNNYHFEKVHLKKCKYFSGVHERKSNFCTCELGRLPRLPVIIPILKRFF